MGESIAEVAAGLARAVWDQHRKTAALTFDTISDEARSILVACCAEGLSHRPAPPEDAAPPAVEKPAQRRPFLMTGRWELDPTGRNPGIYIDDPDGGDPLCLATIKRLHRPEELRNHLISQGADHDR